MELFFKVHLHTKKFCEVFDRAQIAQAVNIRRIYSLWGTFKVVYSLC